VVATWEITGTHTNAFTSVIGETIPATNKKIKVAASTLYEFKDGSLIRQDTYLDQYALLSQLGALGVAQG
jgi:predicted ester cyclase